MKRKRTSAGRDFETVFRITFRERVITSENGFQCTIVYGVTCDRKGKYWSSRALVSKDANMNVVRKHVQEKILAKLREKYYGKR